MFSWFEVVLVVLWVVWKWLWLKAKKRKKKKRRYVGFKGFAVKSFSKTPIFVLAITLPTDI